MARDNDSTTEKLTLNIDSEKKDYYRETSSSMSGKTREILETYAEAEQELGLRGDLEETQLIVLRTYKTALEKNIHAMENQLEKIEERIDDMEDDDEEEVLFEVKLDLEGYNV